MCGHEELHKEERLTVYLYPFYLLIDHSPEIGNRVVQGPLGADPVFPVFVSADEVGIDIVGALFVFNFGKVNACLIVALNVGVAIFGSGKSKQNFYKKTLALTEKVYRRSREFFFLLN